MLLYFVLLHGWGCGEYVAEFILTPLQSTGLVFKIQTLQKNNLEDKSSSIIPLPRKLLMTIHIPLVIFPPWTY